MQTTSDLAVSQTTTTTRSSPVPDREHIYRAIEDFQHGRDRDRNFRIVFESFYRPLQRFFARKGMPADACLDLTQEAMLGIYRGLETYRPEARLETWIYKIATTTYLKSLRSKATAKRSGKEVSAEQVETTEPALSVGDEQLEAVLGKERREALERAVAQLPEKMRKCLTLRIYHGLSYREVATAMQLSVDTVKAHLHQGRKKLKEGLAGFGEAGTIDMRTGS